LCRDQHEQAASELRQQLTVAEETQSQQKRQIVELKQHLAAARGGEDQHAAEMAALATQLAVSAHDLDVARGDGERLQQKVQVGTASYMASWS
jgi:chromosome segregation ATPase